VEPTHEPNVPAEVAFDRFFRNELPPEMRGSYKGKQDLDAIADESTRLLLEEIQKSINNVYRAQRYRVVVRRSRPNLHFDYVRAEVVNAIAFEYEGFAFIGVTNPMFDEVGEICTLLVASESVSRIFRSGSLTKYQERQMFTAFFAILLQFVACHELGHHFHGHCAPDERSIVLWEEFADYETDRAGFRNQAKEVDADAFAVHMLLRNCISGASRSKFLELLGHPVNEVSDFPLLSALVTAAGSFFFSRRRTFHRNALSELTHPPPAARMHFVMEEIVSWMKEHLPSASASVDLPLYRELMEAAARALAPKTSDKPWEEQTAFLVSAEGRAYLELLREHRLQVRDEMCSKRWELQPGTD
jgi:hypothetical protein